MKRALVFALLAIVCLAAALPAAAAPLDDAGVAARIAAAPAPAAGEDGLVLFEGNYYHYADGLLSHRHQRLLRVSTEWALERLADPRLRFDSSRQKITVHAARTYFPGGGSIDSPANAFNTVTPGELALAPDFLDIQELVITQVGLEPGCFLWLDTEIVDTAPASLPEGALLFPQGDFPVREMEVTADGLYAELVNPEGGLLALPAGTSEGLRHAWHFENLPAAPGQATYRLGDQLPHLNLSPLESWEEVVRAVNASVWAAAEDTAGLAAWVGDVERRLERPFLDGHDAFAALAAGLGERTTFLNSADWAWSAPRSVARVLATSVATPLERAALLMAAARKQDVWTRIQLPRRWQARGDQVLTLASLDVPLLATLQRLVLSGTDIDRLLASAEGKLLARNEEPTLDSYSLSDRQAGQIIPGRPQSIEVASRLYWDLKSGAFAMTIAVEPAGHWHAAGTPESGLRDWVQSWTDSSQVESLTLREGGPDRILADLFGKSALPAADEAGRVRFALPMSPVELADLLPPGMQRTQSSCRAVLYPRPAALQMRWILDLPSEFDVAIDPPDSLQSPGAGFWVHRELVGRRLTVEYFLNLMFIASWLPVTPADYPAFRALVNAALDPKATEVLLVPRAKD